VQEIRVKLTCTTLIAEKPPTNELVKQEDDGNATVKTNFKRNIPPKGKKEA
jgi:hypothetical protein